MSSQHPTMLIDMTSNYIPHAKHAHSTCARDGNFQSHGKTLISPLQNGRTHSIDLLLDTIWTYRTVEKAQLRYRLIVIAVMDSLLNMRDTKHKSKKRSDTQNISPVERYTYAIAWETSKEWKNPLLSYRPVSWKPVSPIPMLLDS